MEESARIVRLSNSVEISSARLRHFISVETIKIGFMPSYDGFRYFKELLLYVVENAGADRLMTMYERAAKEFRISAAQLERGVRTMIEKSFFNNGRFAPLYDFFGLKQDDRPPTIGQILSLMGEYIELCLFEIATEEGGSAALDGGVSKLCVKP